MARACGSYPQCHWFESNYRYQFGPMVKRLRHRPFTAVSGVQFPLGSPCTIGAAAAQICAAVFSCLAIGIGAGFSTVTELCVENPAPFFAEDLGRVEEGNGDSARRRSILRRQGFTGSRFDGGSGGDSPPPRCRSGHTPRCSSCKGPRRTPRWRARCNGQRIRPPCAAPRGRCRSPPRR